MLIFCVKWFTTPASFPIISELLNMSIDESYDISYGEASGLSREY